MHNSIVYSSRLSIELHIRRTYLESYDIPCRIEGEALLSARPDLQVDATLIVTDPGKLETAKKLLENFKAPENKPESEKWTCPKCLELIQGQFTDCWSCGYSKKI